jgi:hypothetical protein
MVRLQIRWRFSGVPKKGRQEVSDPKVGMDSEDIILEDDAIDTKLVLAESFKWIKKATKCRNLSWKCDFAGLVFLNDEKMPRITILLLLGLNLSDIAIARQPGDIFNPVAGWAARYLDPVHDDAS